ncbi:hypothetical protein Barb4_03886 [Bacteroidales bacterium Barb4]|nr:hypothetical protein Barb4_03886 [Bacteroidales bacterium Barb4]
MLHFVSFFQNLSSSIVLITPHFASLHVGLKSLAPSGHLRNVLPLVALRKRKCCTFAARKTDNLTGKR